MVFDSPKVADGYLGPFDRGQSATQRVDAAPDSRDFFHHRRELRRMFAAVRGIWMGRRSSRETGPSPLIHSRHDTILAVRIGPRDNGAKRRGRIPRSHAESAK